VTTHRCARPLSLILSPAPPPLTFLAAWLLFAAPLCHFDNNKTSLCA